MRALFKLVEGQNRMAVVDYDDIFRVLLEPGLGQDLSRSNLCPRMEAIDLTIFAIVFAEVDHSVDAEGLADDHLEGGVELGHDQNFLLLLVQVHDDLVSEVELLTGLPVNVFLLDEVLHEEHEWAVTSVETKETLG